MPRRVTVSAPSRLHFGLYGFGPSLQRQFGGIGAMIESPGVQLEATTVVAGLPTEPQRHGQETGRNSSILATGPLADRVRKFAQVWADFHRLDAPPACHIIIDDAPQEHSGLGVGTQLGLSVAAALNALFEIGPCTPAELAHSVGRGVRSAVGTYGFVQGGLIAERGKLPDETISPLDVRVEIPPAWRFVLVTPRVPTGLAGDAEAQAFDQLPPVPAATTQELIRLVREELIPSAVQANFPRFSAALYRYCHDAGLYFAAVQGGAYNGPLLTRLIETMRTGGVEGVGQSSWGPTLFALLPDETSAVDYVTRLRTALPDDIEVNLHITPPNNRGARVTIEE